MGPLQRQVILWCFSHGSSQLEAVRSTVLHLTTPDIDASSLVSFVKLHFTKATIIFAIVKVKAVIFSLVLIKRVGLIILFRDIR